MKYLGIARTENDHVIMPDGFEEISSGKTFEVIELGGDFLLMPSPLDRQRLDQVEQLTTRSIEEHRKSLEGLAD